MEPVPSFDDPHQTHRDLLAARNREQLNAIFRPLMRASGFVTYAAGYVPDHLLGAAEGGFGREPFLLLDWPAAWLELYARQGFARDDIVVAEAARTSTPFTWTEIRQRYPGASEPIFAAASQFGWDDGFVIPIHDPHGSPAERFGVISLAAPHLRGFTDEVRRFVVSTALVALGAARVLARGSATGEPRLTRREAEALSLVARGMSNDEIAGAMQVSVRTAHFHVENAKRRLAASTRAQAVAIALTHRLLVSPA